MAHQAVREFGRVLATEPVDRLRALFSDAPSVTIHSQHSVRVRGTSARMTLALAHALWRNAAQNSLDDLIEWIDETRHALPSLRFDPEIIAVNDKVRALLACTVLRCLADCR